MTTPKKGHLREWVETTNPYLSEMYDEVDRRQKEHECVMCETDVTEVTFRSEWMPHHWGYCSEACANDWIKLYCMVEGK